MRLVSLRFAPALLLLASLSPAADPRPLTVNDFFALKSVGAPVLSPDGAYVAYTVRTLDLKKDKSDADIYLIPTAGGEAVRLTTSEKAETNPRFSPDGKWIAFLSSRDGDKSQVFLLSRVHEAYLKTGDSHRSVAIGIGGTARVITTAAAVMIVAFASFVPLKSSDWRPACASQ